jgi:hypothetical protein
MRAFGLEKMQLCTLWWKGCCSSALLLLNYFAIWNFVLELKDAAGALLLNYFAVRLTVST